jgi:hydroxycarboxylate dehydrogenase B
MADSMLVQATRLRALVESICRAAGSNEREAKLIAEQLVLANLSGHDSHGVGMLPTYIGAMRDGRAVVNHKLSIVQDSGALVTVDGGRGLGQVMAYETMELGIERARQYGVCVIGLRNSYHIGRIGHWGEQCARAGMVSIHYTNVTDTRAAVAPFGGTDARYGTNPYCTAIPTRSGEPILLDFATSVIAVGKARVAMNKGQTVAPGILIDANGKPTTDPSTLFDAPTGALMPFGDHKGSGLALIAELLAGALTGPGTIAGTTANGRVINCMLTIIFDPSKLAGTHSYLAEIDRLVDWVKASPPAQGTDRVLVAGEPERERRVRFGREGIAIDQTTWTQILDAAESVGIARGTITI